MSTLDRTMIERLKPAIAMLSAALLLTACAASQSTAPAESPAPGFFLAFWHGLIAPVAFLVGLFDAGVRIYAFPNGGLWYDFGFMLGIGGFSGGVFAGSRGKSRCG
jgi:hypothetical protein